MCYTVHGGIDSKTLEIITSVGSVDKNSSSIVQESDLRAALRSTQFALLKSNLSNPLELLVQIGKLVSAKIME